MEVEKLINDKEAAAQLLATGGLNKTEISKRLDISRSTLWKWEQDDNMKARVYELKHDFESFASDLIHSRLIDAVDGYWSLVKSSDNDRVKADGYKFFIERSLGKVSNELKVSTYRRRDF